MTTNFVEKWEAQKLRKPLKGQRARVTVDGRSRILARALSAMSTHRGTIHSHVHHSNCPERQALCSVQLTTWENGISEELRAARTLKDKWLPSFLSIREVAISTSQFPWSQETCFCSRLWQGLSPSMSLIIWCEDSGYLSIKSEEDRHIGASPNCFNNFILSVSTYIWSKFLAFFILQIDSWCYFSRNLYLEVYTYTLWFKMPKR